MENLSLDPPIACTLTDADLRDRRAAWLKVGEFVIASEPIPGGLSVDFARAAGVADSLAELVRLEAECCAWMTFEIEESPTKIRLSITGIGTEGERGVRESFVALIRG